MKVFISKCLTNQRNNLISLTPLNAVDFEILTQDLGLIFAKSNKNMLVYNRDGKMPTHTLDNASLVVAKAFSKSAITNELEFAKNKIKMSPVQITKINTVVPIKINELNGYEIIADGTDLHTGKKEQVYQVLLFADTSYYILVGFYEANFESNLRLMKKLVKTFKRK